MGLLELVNANPGRGMLRLDLRLDVLRKVHHSLVQLAFHRNGLLRGVEINFGRNGVVGHGPRECGLSSQGRTTACEVGLGWTNFAAGTLT